MKMAGIGFSAGRFIHLFPYRNFFPKNNLFQLVVSILSDLIYDKMSKLIFNFFHGNVQIDLFQKNWISAVQSMTRMFHFSHEHDQ